MRHAARMHTPTLWENSWLFLYSSHLLIGCICFWRTLCLATCSHACESSRINKQENVVIFWRTWMWGGVCCFVNCSEERLIQLSFKDMVINNPQPWQITPDTYDWQGLVLKTQAVWYLMVIDDLSRGRLKCNHILHSWVFCPLWQIRMSKSR